MRTGGVEVPINGDVVVYRQSTGLDEQYFVRTFPHSSDGEAYPTHDSALEAATRMAAAAGVNVFFCQLPHSPTLLKPFRAI